MNTTDKIINTLTNPQTSPTEWFTTISEALQADLFSNTWSSSQGPACRVTFTFPDGLNIAWIGDGSSTYPELTQIWVNNDGTWYPETGNHEEEPITCPISTLGLETEWNPRLQLWQIEDILEPHDIATLITQATYVHGTPTITLPWGNLEYSDYEDNLHNATSTPWDKPVPLQTTLNYINSEEFTQILEELNDITTEDNTPELNLILTYLMNKSEALTAPEEWGDTTVNMAEGDTNLPPHSPYNKFQKFAENIYNLPNWVVNWDECCGTCHGSTYRMLIENENLPEGSPCLTIWGQNAQYDYSPNGYINHTTYTKDPTERNTIRELAQANGLLVHETQDAINLY